MTARQLGPETACSANDRLRAEIDVRDVLPLADQLTHLGLREMNRVDWFEYLRAAPRVMPSFNDNRPTPRKPGGSPDGGTLQPRGLAALRAIWQWRHLEAGNASTAFKVLNSEALRPRHKIPKAGGLPEPPARFPHPVRREISTTRSKPSEK